MARQFTPEAVKTLVDVLLDTKEKGAARVAAAETLLSRGWGRPVTPIVDLSKVSDTDLLSEARKLLVAKGLLHNSTEALTEQRLLAPLEQDE